MSKPAVKLFPEPVEQVPLEGLYLNLELHTRAEALGRPFVYSNFIMSLDGRIAIPRPGETELSVPETIANPRDWRLFQELAVQADLLITTGRYLREYAEGRGQEILRVYEQPTFTDLRRWRQSRGLQLYPDLAVLSNSLDFPLPGSLTEGDRQVVIVTSENADPERLSAHKDRQHRLLVAGERVVEAGSMVSQLSELGYRTVYSTAGPKVFHLLLQGKVLDQLFLTTAHRILGSSAFSSVVEGPPLEPPTDFQLDSLYYDPEGLGQTGQFFASYRSLAPQAA